MDRSLKTGVWILGLLPIAWIGWRFFQDGLGANPIEALLHLAGRWALVFLLLTLAVTPIRRVSRWNRIVKIRRPLGLFAFGPAKFAPFAQPLPDPCCGPGREWLRYLYPYPCPCPCPLRSRLSARSMVKTSPFTVIVAYCVPSKTTTTVRSTSLITTSFSRTKM